MKKLALLVFSALTLVGCSLDDDGPNTLFEVAEITQVDIPDYFEEGESYEIDVTFLLPSACHTFYSFDAYEGEDNDEENKEYFVGAFTSYDGNLTECNEDGEGDDLLETRSLEITVRGEVGTIYTFNFWIGEDGLGEDEYYTVEVPVIDPDDTDLEENED